VIIVVVASDLWHLQSPCEGEKGTTLCVCDIAALNKTSKNNRASARTNQPQKIKEGESSVYFGHKKNLDCHTEDINNDGGKYNHT
jgi:hypothetical protein